MKAGLFNLLIVLLMSQCLSAQNKFDTQIRAIVSDTINGFAKLKGAFDHTSRVYHPKGSIDSAVNTKIFSVSSRSYYVFEVAQSRTSDPEQAEKTLIRWKQKLVSALGPAFVIAPESAPIGLKKFFDQGYVFSHGKLYISLEQLNDSENGRKIHYVRVFIMYKPGSD